MLLFAMDVHVPNLNVAGVTLCPLNRPVPQSVLTLPSRV